MNMNMIDYNRSPITDHRSPITGALPGLYIHVPFCRGKCPYCDFYSVPALSLIERWHSAIEQEALLYREHFSLFDSLYVGGGTPSVLSADSFQRLLHILRNAYAFAADTEVTVELNPEDTTAALFKALRSSGVNRLSFGVQSFDDRELTFLKRRHTARDARVALETSRSAGFENISIDLMYLIPGQSEESWLCSLEEALSFAPAHLSCYQLTCEARTPFGRMKADGQIAVPDEETERRFFLLTSRFLRDHGFIHYEISNFARDEKSISRHNQKYWRHIPYLGLGPAAHSFDGTMRWWNARSVKTYCKALAAGERPVEGSETLTTEQLRLERLYLGLRTRAGVLLTDACDRAISAPELSSLEGEGLVRIQGDRVLPTIEGYCVADQLPLMFPG
jgi:putative oxygen-independent coproporphyrinogen III oxidase